MKFGVFWIAVTSLAIFGSSVGSYGTVEAKRVRIVCDNPAAGGTPNRFEMDLSRKTILEFEGDGSADDPIEPDPSSVPLVVTKTSMRWTDPFDGHKYSLQRTTSVLTKWQVDGTPLYTKTCRILPPGTPWN